MEKAVRELFPFVRRQNSVADDDIPEVAGAEVALAADRIARKAPGSDRVSQRPRKHS